MRKSLASHILSLLHKVKDGIADVSYMLEHNRKYGTRMYKINTYYTSLNRLKNQGFIKKQNNIFRLTSKGEKRAFYLFIDAESEKYKPKKQKWDGKWRVIFFDIPESKRRHRDFLRSMIRAIGFKELQKSIWVYPYKIPAFLNDLLWEENIKPYTRFITTEQIDYDKDLRKIFQL